MSRYLSNLKKDIPRWIEEGWVSAAGADAILADAAAHKSKFSFANVLAVLGALLLCFGALPVSNGGGSPGIGATLNLVDALFINSGPTERAEPPWRTAGPSRSACPHAIFSVRVSEGSFY